MYKPKEINDLRVPMKLMVVERYEKTNGVSKPVYKEADDPVIYCNFKTYGGKETTIDGRYVILDTAKITTWYRPDITSDCQIIRLSDNAKFDIINEPENMGQGNKYMQFTVERVKGRA